MYEVHTVHTPISCLRAVVVFVDLFGYCLAAPPAPLFLARFFAPTVGLVQ
jgi:hypothetical protein